MKNFINLVVEEELHGKRIDVVIAKRNDSLSRTRIKNLIINGNLSINNKIVNDPSKKIFKGDKVFLTIQLPKKASLKPFKYKLDIIYNDEDLLVLYGLYKQSTIGDCNTNEPGFFEFTAKTKWNSWNNYKGKSKNESMNLYIEKAKNVIDNYS